MAGRQRDLRQIDAISSDMYLALHDSQKKRLRRTDLRFPSVLSLSLANVAADEWKFCGRVVSPTTTTMSEGDGNIRDSKVALSSGRIRHAF